MVRGGDDGGGGGGGGSGMLLSCRHLSEFMRRWYVELEMVLS